MGRSDLPFTWSLAEVGGMAMNFHECNHTPQWYRDHAKGEKLSSPSKGMLRRDMNLLGADIDSTHVDTEKIGVYEERWKAIMDGDGCASQIAAMGSAIEKESSEGFRPKNQYSQEPYKTITRIMTKHNLSTTDVGEFLKWSAKDVNLKKAREAKAKKIEKEDAKHREKVANLFLRRKSPWNQVGGK